MLHSIVRPLAFFEQAKLGTTVIHLGKRDIDKFRVVVPSDSVLDAFAAITDPLVRGSLLDSRSPVAALSINEDAYAEKPALEWLQQLGWG